LEPAACRVQADSDSAETPQERSMVLDLDVPEVVRLEGALIIVAPDTGLRWHRRRFRAHWATLSGRPPRGRPPVNAEIIAPVRKMAAANPLWGAPRIHGELRKLGIDVAERTVSRLISNRRPPALTDVANIPRQPR